MRRFAELLERLVFTPSRNDKLRLMADYFATCPDPARGYGLAALTGDLSLRTAKPAAVRALAAERVDPALFAWSYDFVGDLAETTALIWPEAGPAVEPPGLDEVVERLQAAGRTEVPGLLRRWLDESDATTRFALLKLITGGLRVGVSARFARAALAQMGAVEPAEIEELWNGLEPPYAGLFAWLEGRAERPRIDDRGAFRPLMLATALDAERDLPGLEAGDFAAEWKWDGIRVQIAAAGGVRRLYSRTGDDIGEAFPDVLDAVDFDAVLDGELLVLRGGEPAPFNDLQQRLGRKTVGRRLLQSHPAHVRLYDILWDGREDQRSRPFRERREHLETWHSMVAPDRMDLSERLAFLAWDELAGLRENARAAGIEGIMLKRLDSPYIAGRPKGHWFKWKRDALLLDCVLMYAQRGHGRRSSYFSDYIFGVWRPAENGGEELVPVGKAYFGFTDEELAQLDRWVRANTVERFGPVSRVEAGLVLEIAFDSVHPSRRHKSGLAMRFPRVHRIRWDKPPAEADRLETVAALVVA